MNIDEESLRIIKEILTIDKRYFTLILLAYLWFSWNDREIGMSRKIFYNFFVWSILLYLLDVSRKRIIGDHPKKITKCKKIRIKTFKIILNLVIATFLLQFDW